MADIEKVIREAEEALEFLAPDDKRRLHMGIMMKLGWIYDALALLKEQEARILDWDELEDWENAVWFEDKDEHECYIALISNVGTYDAKFTNVEPGNIHSLDFMRDFYMKEWRCWSARPAIKQRQDVKWE